MQVQQVIQARVAASGKLKRTDENRPSISDLLLELSRPLTRGTFVTTHMMQFVRRR